jgi:hyaluronoglucosaminidase
VSLPSSVALVTDATTDPAVKDLLTSLVRDHGVRTGGHGLIVRLGAAVADTPSQAEGYALSVSRAGITIGGRDGAGQYYGVQTLRQLFVHSGHGWVVRGVAVRDWPNMVLRGSIEGFYGPPWTTADRLRQLAFLGEVKANTYVYSAKDDTYLRARWRDPYPADELATLGQLVRPAAAHHVEFTYALSPGVSVCFSSPADVAAVEAKAAFGATGQAAAGTAQVSLLNAITEKFVKTHDGVRPLQTVPTEYSDLKDSPYKTELREHLDPSVVVQ